jgi:hypothetical protein
MMKKMLSLLLCAALLLTCAAALADTASVDIRDRFQIKGTLPDGYKLSVLSQDDLVLEGEISSDDPAAPIMRLYVSFNETYAAKDTLKDMSDQELQVICQSFTEEYSVTFDRLDTASGVPLLSARETGDSADFLDFYTIFRGHEIELWLSKVDGADDPTLTEAQISRCIELIKTLEIIPLR